MNAARAPHQWARLAAPVTLFAAAVLVYVSSLRGQFIFDDLKTIVRNPAIRGLLPDPQVATTIGGRPLLSFSLALNYAMGGLAVWPYHLVNILIHASAALVLFDIIRRTLRRAALDSSRATGFAFAVALLWAVHPLNTQCVTYIIQRGELLAGLGTLLTLYCLLSAEESARGGTWQALGVLSCFGAVASKPTAAIIPLVAAVYDRWFLSGSFRRMWQRRWPCYLGLLLSWGFLWLLLRDWLQLTGTQASFPYAAISAMEYARTQPEVILHYLKLALWPAGLCLDYLWPVQQDVERMLWPLAALSALLIATLAACRRRHPAGFLGLWFFITLAPTSSVFPLADVAAEQRMYLPLIAVVAWLVWGAWAVLRRLAWPPTTRLALAVGLTGMAALLLGGATIRRNTLYRSPLLMWEDVAAKRPANQRAHYNLAIALSHAGRPEEAERHFREAIRLMPRYVEAHNNLGLLLVRQGRPSEGAEQYRNALRIDPSHDVVRYNLGLALLQQGQAAESIEHFSELLSRHPRSGEVHNDLGVAWLQLGDRQKAIEHFSAAVRYRPDLAVAQRNLQAALAGGRLPDDQPPRERPIR